jgi:oligopeptide/dipeptide ABC transporter ATP-binding protein
VTLGVASPSPSSVGAVGGGGGPLVSAFGLTKDFGGSGGFLTRSEKPLRAVAEVSLEIGRGEILGVVGESGSGKSTLGRLLLRLVEPTEGTITFDGEDVSAMPARDLRRFRRHMQMIFQDPYASLNARMTVGDALSESLRLHRSLTRSDAKDAAATLLAQVGLTREHLARYPRAFSGGQRQRVAIARALASQPRFIVADEPVSALDVSIQAEVINLLQDLQRELGLSLMFISHDLSVVEVIADRVMVLYLGRVMETAPTEALFSRPAHPYTAILMQAAPGARRAGDRLLAAGEIPSPRDPPSGCVFRTRCPFAIPACAEGGRPASREIAPGHFKACIRDDIAL